VQNLVKIGRSVAELLRIFDFEKAAFSYLGFSSFHNICHKFKLVSISTFTCKIWWRSDGLRPSYCAFSIFKMADVRHLGFSYFRNIFPKFKFASISMSTYRIYSRIGWFAAELLRIFDYQTGGHPPSLIWYDVIAVHPRLVFDGPNVLLKLHVDRIYTLQDIAISIFGPFGLKLPIHALLGEFLGILPKWIPILSQPPKWPSLGNGYEPQIVKIHPWVRLGRVPDNKKYSVTN